MRQALETRLYVLGLFDVATLIPFDRPLSWPLTLFQLVICWRGLAQTITNLTR